MEIFLGFDRLNGEQPVVTQRAPPCAETRLPVFSQSPKSYAFKLRETSTVRRKYSVELINSA